MQPSTAAPALSQAPVVVGRVQVPETVLPQEEKIKIAPKTAKPAGDLGLRSPPPRGRSPDAGMRSPAPQAQPLRPEQIPEEGELREQWVRDTALRLRKMKNLLAFM